MARIEIGTKNFEEARKELASIGIILYRKEHRKGGYICRASRTLRESIERRPASKAIRIAYIPSENVLPRTRVPRSPTAPQRFNRVYTVSLAERRPAKKERRNKDE